MIVEDDDALRERLARAMERRGFDCVWRAVCQRRWVKWTALLFGDMVLYSFGFAVFVFNALPPETAGPLIRRAFPHFYLFVLASSAVAAAVALASDPVSSAILGSIAATTILARQVLMPAINTATDQSAKTRFKVLHSLSVVITLAHIAAANVVLVRLAVS